MKKTYLVKTPVRSATVERVFTVLAESPEEAVRMAKAGEIIQDRTSVLNGSGDPRWSEASVCRADEGVYANG